MLALLWSIAVVTRVALHLQGYYSEPQAWVSDTFFALALSVLTRRSVLLSAVMLGLWTVVYWGDWLFITSMGSVFDHKDIHFLLDLRFLRSSLGPYWLAVLSSAFLCLVLSMWFSARVLDRFAAASNQTGKQFVLELSIAGLIVAHSVSTAEDWSNSSLAALHIGAVYYDLSASESNAISLSRSHRAQDFGVQQMATGQVDNVLLIVMEGLTGSYLPAVAKEYAHNSGVYMSGTSGWAERAWNVPDFITHVRQTNRGLYAILCGDYPHMRGGNPKPMELLDNPVEASNCLPHLLKSKGYNTAYFQAADLEFMSKDKSRGFKSEEKWL